MADILFCSVSFGFMWHKVLKARPLITMDNGLILHEYDFIGTPMIGNSGMTSRYCQLLKLPSLKLT